MENAASVRARAQANIAYSIERLFIVAALFALAVATYVTQGGSLVVVTPSHAFIAPSIYGALALIVLLASVAVRMNGGSGFLRVLSSLQVILDLIALLRGEYVHPEEVRHLLTTYHLEGALQSFLTLLGEHTKLPELDLNAHMFAKEKKHLLSAFL